MTHADSADAHQICAPGSRANARRLRCPTSVVPDGQPPLRLLGRLGELNTSQKDPADLVVARFTLFLGWSSSSPTSCLLPQQKQGPRASAASRQVGTTTPRYGDNPAPVQAGGNS